MNREFKTTDTGGRVESSTDNSIFLRKLHVFTSSFRGKVSNSRLGNLHGKFGESWRGSKLRSSVTGNTDERIYETELQKTEKGDLQQVEMAVNGTPETSILSKSHTYRTVKKSWLYGWLTGEPETEVVVLDLERTRTTGPIIKFIDQTVRTVIPAWMQSGLRTVYEKTARYAREKTVRVASGLVFTVSVIFMALLEYLDMKSLPSFVLLMTIAVVAGYGIRSDRSWEELRETKAVTIATKLIRPPELDQEDDTASDHRESSEEKTD
ncbi:MAG: hypothetical protein ABEK59_05765 [Halobacteria archaeon]